MSFVEIFRAVMEEEKAQIGTTNLLQNPFGIENKYFALTENGANSYAQMAFGRLGDDSPYYIIKVVVPESLTGDRFFVDGGIESIVLETEQLVGLEPEILNYSLRTQ